MLGSRLNGQRPLGVGCSDQGVFLDLREIAESLNETHSISANVEFPWLVGRFPPARHSGAAKICFIPGHIMVCFTQVRAIGSLSGWAELVEHHEC